MGTTEAEEALRWLADVEVTPLGPARWQEITPAGPVELTDDDLAQAWAGTALHDDELSPMQRLRIGLGLLEVTDAFWVTAELGFFLQDRSDPALAAAFWAGCRRRLESAEPSVALRVAMVTDYFLGFRSAEEAFNELIGDEMRALRAGRRLRELAGGPLHRRFARVLAASGPVRWAYKHDVYAAAAEVAELHPAVFDALLASRHGSYGDLEPVAALALLDRLDLPPDTEHLAALRAALAAPQP